MTCFRIPALVTMMEDGYVLEDILMMEVNHVIVDLQYLQDTPVQVEVPYLLLHAHYLNLQLLFTHVLMVEL
jgi:hypothetical protein